jgi:hypothetical protein
MTLRDPVCRRSGAALLWALVVLGVLAVTSATAVWQIGAARRGLSLRQNRLQAVWLARSGFELAAGRLLADPADYSGETLELVPESRVRVIVEKDSTQPDTYRVRAEATFPVGDRTEVSRSLTRRIAIRADGDRKRIEVLPDDEAPP